MRGLHSGAVVGLGLALGLWGCEAPAPTVPERVVLVSIDTLRADHLGCYGAVPSPTPRLDALAEAGVRFEQAIAPTPLTLPSHASLFTALDPPHHGVRNNSIFALDESVPTLAERLAAAGLAGGAFVGAVVLDRQYGLARGFDHYDDAMSTRRHVGETGFAERRADQVVDAALAWLDDAPERFFLWVHLYDPHAAYEPPPPFRDDWAAAPYAGEIAFADAQLGRLLDAVDARWPAETTLVAVTSDHGESLGEHGEPSHGYSLYDATQRVPLLLRGPGLPAGHTVTQLVRLADVAPTILARLGLEPLPGADGADLSPLFAGAAGSAAAPERVAYLETLAPQTDLGWSPLLGLRSSRWKYVRAPRPELYDLVADPYELRELAAKRPVEVARLDGELASRLEGARGELRRLTPGADERARLEALGYVVAPVETRAEALGVVGGLDPKDGLPALRRLGAALAGLESDPAAALAALESLPGAGPMIALSRTEAALEAGDAAAAERHAEAALAGAPELSFAWLLLGRSRELAGRADEARAAFERAAALDEAAGEPWVGLGRLAEGEGDAERALALYQRAAGRRGRSAEALWRAAALLIESGHDSEAAELLATLPAEQLRRPGAALRLARAEVASGRRDAARRRLETARLHARGPRERAILDRALQDD